jgi:anti-anti-sigma factor
MTTSSAERKLSPVTMFAHKETVITVKGSLDATTIPDLERMVANNLDVGVVVLELSAVSTFDQAALDALLRIQATCDDQSVALRVAPNDVVRSVIVAARVAPRFTLADPH